MKPWTLKEQDRLIEMYVDESKPVSEIAKELGRTEGSVYARTRTLGLKRKPMQFEVYRGHVLLAEGTAQECADELGITLNAFYTHHYRTKRPTRKNLDRVILVYAVEG